MTSNTIKIYNQTNSSIQFTDNSLEPNSSQSFPLLPSRQINLDGLDIGLLTFHRGFIENERFSIFQELIDGEFTWTVLPPRSLTNWTSTLPDDLNIEKITFPGTHESLALHGFPHSTCQSNLIENQLKMGIRAFDFRFSLLPNQEKTGNELRAFHGIIDQKCFALDAFQALYDFLNGEGKGETIILSIKQENAEQGFEEAVFQLIEQNSNFWYLESRFPNLSEVRGKIILFCRFQHRELNGGLHSPLWPDSQSSIWDCAIGGIDGIKVQDWYKVPSISDIKIKANLVLDLFNPSTNKFSINFSSGSSFPILFPIVVSKGIGLDVDCFGKNLRIVGVNEIILRELLRKKRDGRLGEGSGMLLMSDYASRSSGLIQILIARNF